LWGSGSRSLSASIRIKKLDGLHWSQDLAGGKFLETILLGRGVIVLVARHKNATAMMDMRPECKHIALVVSPPTFSHLTLFADRLTKVILKDEGDLREKDSVDTLLQIHKLVICPEAEVEIGNVPITNRS